MDSNKEKKSFGPLLKRQREIIQTCEESLKIFENEEYISSIKKMKDIHEHFEAAHSGSYIGYHADTYINGFQKAKPHEYFGAEWGMSRSTSFIEKGVGDWVTYPYADVISAIKLAAEMDLNKNIITDITDIAQKNHQQIKSIATATLQAILRYTGDDTFLQDKLEEIKKTTAFLDVSIIEKSILSSAYSTRDSRAALMGNRIPAHTHINFIITSRIYSKKSIQELKQTCEEILYYMEAIESIESQNLPNTIPQIKHPNPPPTTVINPTFNTHIETPMSQHNNNINGNGNNLNAPSASNGSSVTMGDVTQTTHVVMSPTDTVTQEMFEDDAHELTGLIRKIKDLEETVHEALWQFLGKISHYEAEGKELRKVQEDMRQMIEEIWLSKQKEDMKTPIQRLINQKTWDAFASKKIFETALGAATLGATTMLP